MIGGTYIESQFECQAARGLLSSLFRGGQWRGRRRGLGSKRRCKAHLKTSRVTYVPPRGSRLLYLGDWETISSAEAAADCLSFGFLYSSRLSGSECSFGCRWVQRVVFQPAFTVPACRWCQLGPNVTIFLSNSNIYKWRHRAGSKGTPRIIAADAWAKPLHQKTQLA